MVLSPKTFSSYVTAIKTLAEDTQPAAEAVLVELLRRASPSRKIALMLSANRTARELAMTGLRERHPSDSAAQLRRRLADLWLGPELAAKAYGPMPKHEEATELLQAIARVVSAFNTLGVDYLVGGSVASSLFGEPRQTLDADLVARLLGRHAEPLTADLKNEFYADLPAIRAAIQNQGSFNLIHLQTMTKVDVFVRWRDAFAQSQFARRQKKSVGEGPPLEFLFASAEDTVLSKLEWYERGGQVSERQWRDVLGVMKVQAGALDRDYLTRWANKLGLSPLLQRALDEAGLSK